MEPRSAVASELDALARLWHDTWRESHVALSPPELVSLRTLDSFRERLGTYEGIVVAGPVGAPLGFYVLRDDELYQFFLARESRGSGLAGRLLADAEKQLVARGVDTAWLACAIGNDRAARFYEKSGWRRTGAIVNPAETSRGPFPDKVWRYEKRLRPAI
ncbi:MAG: GNAT family N-acetyltransferase [Hyphomicrobiaceae bacterium]|nr:GNAT family N-acetyltransferase [Hyphomicrobiaceae bacterium]